MIETTLGAARGAGEHLAELAQCVVRHVTNAIAFVAEVIGLTLILSLFF
jgi:hypothetical protein